MSAASSPAPGTVVSVVAAERGEQFVRDTNRAAQAFDVSIGRCHPIAATLCQHDEHSVEWVCETGRDDGRGPHARTLYGIDSVGGDRVADDAHGVYDFNRAGTGCGLGYVLHRFRVGGHEVVAVEAPAR